MTTTLIKLTEDLKADFIASKPVNDPLAEADWHGSVEEVLDRILDMHRELLKAGGGEHPMSKDFLKLMAQELEAKLPDQWGFLLLAAPYGEGGHNRCVYTSTMQREDALRLMKEFIIKCGAGEDWMKHIK
jgi:hypothetical protein